MNCLAVSLLKSGVWISMICAVAGLGFAFLLIQRILAASPGNERMRQISGAVQEGAKAYLNRQVITISAIAVVIFILLFIFKDHATAAGFVVGADLVGKIEAGLEEDDPRNPATIADNVGDNVGDCAGMAADVFETYAVSLIGAILIGTLTLGGATPDLARAAVVYPFVLGGISVL